ncbi:hypothetical protein BWI93_07510 [Siphonobacter sp. BAB-5385]|uniref:type IX secretion system membrane protein PorP/SprF n=1 Tax=Siphonobacter sp. BAB-5385 TaxID=1864822 RepID=UPI000B9E576B|nr:type IX secretion system membrane protein PorP/SprF [Siphonobacter sp. BAB-5385]OZI08779.1 hypothetical protein BWI93_07510 [Siphonobacter sp. BAB-5385]
MPRFYFTFWIILFAFLAEVYGQDPQFSQFYANPLAQNPAFTGNARMGRVIVNYRKQAYGLNRDFETMAASYDTYLENTDSRTGQPSLGLGLQLMRDKQGAGTFMGSAEGLYTTSGYISASKRLARFGRDGKYKFWSGMQVGGVSRLFEDRVFYSPTSFRDRAFRRPPWIRLLWLMVSVEISLTSMPDYFSK